MIYNWFKQFANLVIKKEDDMSLTNGSVRVRKLSDAKEGNVVSFVYYGHGQNHGELRYAQVIEVLADGILAQEVNGTHPKHFKNGEAEDVKLEEKLQDAVSGEVKGITFIDAKDMLEEAEWANEIVLDILTGEQLTVLFGSFHTARENADAGEFEYQWDSENGNILVTDNRNAPHVSVKASDDSLHHTLRYVTFRVSNNETGSYSDFRVTVDAVGKITFQNGKNIVSVDGFAKALNSLIKD